MPNYYKSGVWNCVCQVCGFKFKSDQIRKRWDGLLVCDRDYEERHPMDLYRAPPPERPIPWASPELVETHLTVNYVASSVGTQDSTVPSGTFLTSQGYIQLPGTAGNYTSTPDSVNNRFTGDLDIRARVAMTDWTPSTNMIVVAKGIGGGNTSWIFRVDSGGLLRFNATSDGTSTHIQSVSSVIPGVTDGAAKWIRVTRNGTTGDVIFYLSDDGITWTQLGTTQAASTTAIFAGTSLIELGTRGGGGVEPLNGKIYYVDYRGTIDGAISQYMDADWAIEGQRTFSNGSTTWTLNGTNIHVGRDYT